MVSPLSGCTVTSLLSKSGPSPISWELLKQLVARWGFPKNVLEAFQKGKGKGEFGGRRPLVLDVRQMLGTIIASLPQVLIYIDALDQCLPKHLPNLLQSLRDMFRESPKREYPLPGDPMSGEQLKDTSPG